MVADRPGGQSVLSGPRGKKCALSVPVSCGPEAVLFMYIDTFQGCFVLGEVKDIGIFLCGANMGHACQFYLERFLSAAESVPQRLKPRGAS